MNLANLENALEQLRLSDDGVCVHIQDAIDSVESAIREAVEALPVIGTKPAVEVGQVWRDNRYPEWTKEILCVGNDRVFFRNDIGYEGTWKISMLTTHCTLQNPTPEEVALTADDISGGVLDAYQNTWRHTTHRDAIAAAINKYNEEKDRG